MSDLLDVLEGTEASRRVAWAKFYAEAERVQELEDALEREVIEHALLRQAIRRALRPGDLAAVVEEFRTLLDERFQEAR